MRALAGCARARGRAAGGGHLGGQLERAKRKVADHVCVAHHNVVLMHLRSPVEGGRGGKPRDGDANGEGGAEGHHAETVGWGTTEIPRGGG